MSSDTRYMRRVRNVYYARVPVPRDLRTAFGKPYIVKSLKTGDLREAQRTRWGVVQEAQAAFTRARNGDALSSAEIEQEAERVYRRVMAQAQDARQRGAPLYYAGHGDQGTERDGIDEALVLLGEAGDAHDWSPVDADVAEIAARRGVTIDTGSSTREELCRALVAAHREALLTMRAYLDGRVRKRSEQPFNIRVVDPATMQTTVPTRLLRPAARLANTDANAVSITDASGRYVTAMMRDADAAWTEQTKAQYGATFRLFADFASDGPVRSVRREDVAGFLDAMATLCADWGRSPKTKGRSLTYLMEHFVGAPGLSNKTLNRHLAALSGMFKWCRAQGLHEGENPCAGLHRRVGRQSSTGYVPFTVDELNKLFAAPLFAKTPALPKRYNMATALRWVPLVALFSGMRSGEVCQLRPEDVKEEDGVAYFDVHEEVEGQRVKTAASIRRVPVHSALVRLGFLTYVAHVRKQGHVQLFPGLNPGGPDDKLNWYLTKAFGELRKSAGITRARVAFHSLRKNVATALERARVPESEAVQVIGHEKMSLSYTVYSLGLDLPALADVVEKINYAGLVLPRPA